MTYVQFLALLISARQRLPQILEAAQAIYDDVVSMYNLLKDVFPATTGGTGGPLTLNMHAPTTALELDHEEQVLAIYSEYTPQAISLGAGGQPKWDGSRLRKLFSVVQMLLPLFQAVIGDTAGTPAK